MGTLIVSLWCPWFLRHLEGRPLPTRGKGRSRFRASSAGRRTFWARFQACAPPEAFFRGIAEVSPPENSTIAPGRLRFVPRWGARQNKLVGVQHKKLI
jgi:hypothetical protein